MCPLRETTPPTSKQPTRQLFLQTQARQTKFITPASYLNTNQSTSLKQRPRSPIHHPGRGARPLSQARNAEQTTEPPATRILRRQEAAHLQPNNVLAYIKPLFSPEALEPSTAHTTASTTPNYHTLSLTQTRQHAAETKAHQPTSPTTARALLMVRHTTRAGWSAHPSLYA